jgi:5-methylcytosine-specific restriction endonuclease McrA
MSGAARRGREFPQHRWTPEEDKVLQELAGTVSAKDIASRLEGVTKMQVQTRCDSLGLEWRVKGRMTAAREAGEKFYQPLFPCKRGHMSLRRTVNGACVTCELITQRGAPHRTHYKARKRAATQEQLPIEEKRKIWAIYRRARQLTEQTGIPHEVDHIIPLAKGGKHESANLQVLTAHENRKKSSLLNFEVAAAA